MAFPAFFDQVPSLKLRDPLGQLLGATADGIIEYRYADAVRLAGHSCPTVAGAWLTALAGMKALYGDEVPERGGVSVFLPDSEDSGVTGVIAQVLTLVTGAASDNGFKGLGGQHVRCKLLHYDEAGVQGVRFRRNDNGTSVEVSVDTRSVPGDPSQPVLMQAVMQGLASADQQRRFGEVWQQRVSRILLQHADDPAVLQVRRLH